MSVRVNHDETKDLYELGDDVEGVFIAFASIPGPAVKSRIEAVLQHEATAAEAPVAAGAAETATGDYVDNGDGTWTRSSDGAVGHFTPAGFTPTAKS